MLTLYYSPGACSLAAHIILEELGLNYKTIKVDLKTHTYEDGKDYYKINPAGSVPALILETGELITQNGAILPYLADLNPDQHLIPASGTLARIRCHEWLSFISADLHKAFSPLFAPGVFVNSESAKEELKQNSIKKLQHIFKAADKKLEGSRYALGEEYSIVDAYLFVFYRWAKHFKIVENELPNYARLAEQVRARSAVQKVLADEGIA